MKTDDYKFDTISIKDKNKLYLYISFFRQVTKTIYYYQGAYTSTGS